MAEVFCGLGAYVEHWGVLHIRGALLQSGRSCADAVVRIHIAPVVARLGERARGWDALHQRQHAGRPGVLAVALVPFSVDIDIERAAAPGGVARPLDPFAPGNRHVLKQGLAG